MRDDAKATGERVEMLFCLAALEQGLIVSKPFGDSQKYDAITDDNGRLCRVQIKHTTCKRGNYYEVSTKSGGPARRTGYSAEQCDVLAVYILPLSEWHLVPVELVAGRKALVIRTNEHREAWHLLKYG